MKPGKTSFNNILKEKKKVALCIPTSDSEDLILATHVLYDYITDKGIETTVYIGGAISEAQKKYFQSESVLYEEGTSPISYVVSIDYAKTGLDKVTYDIDEKTGKLNFFLTPTQGEFDFNNVEYHTKGNNFDLTVTIGVDSFSKLGKLYESNKKLFSDHDVISLFKGSGTLGDNTVTVPEGSSLIYAVRTLIGDGIDQKSANRILMSIVDSEPLIEGEPGGDFLREIGELVQSGANWTDALNKVYFSKDYLNLDLQIKLMHNVLVDRKNRVIWSKVNNQEVKYAGVTSENFDPEGRIIFNISSEFDLAFAVYEIEKDKLEVIVESNHPGKYSASSIAGVFGGEGDDRHASFTVENMSIRDFEKKVFLVLNDMYGVEVYGSSIDFKASSNNSSSTERNT